MDEAYIRVKGDWKYLYRAVDKDGNAIRTVSSAWHIDFANHTILTATKPIKAPTEG